ncbi:site-specific integrase [Kribbella sp. CA-293567]|uniref:site-specific integrase n=1 Tax=Kribbella sp. CA-293567 TaxID=3002436 RepID=UPI0022DE9463|nr:site-specific integrase [Kribbella sp. CA-293567]WBQ04375.1 site-specific integrase [Kribbella sp. CA-293567]
MQPAPRLPGDNDHYHRVPPAGVGTPARIQEGTGPDPGSTREAGADRRIAHYYRSGRSGWPGSVGPRPYRELHGHHPAPVRRASAQHAPAGLDVDEHLVHVDDVDDLAGVDQLEVAVSPAAVVLAGDHPLAGTVRDFLADQEFAGRGKHTIRCYRGDLFELAQHTDAGVDGIDAAVLRSWSAATNDLAVATRARKQASVAAFLRWAVRRDLIDANPMDKFDRVHVPDGAPRPSRRPGSRR